MQRRAIGHLSPALQCYLLLASRLQTQEDREALRPSVWEASSNQQWAGECDVEDVDVGPMLVRVAEAFANSRVADFVASDADILQCQSLGLSAGCAAVLNNWPTLLIGDGGSGRRRMVEILAAVAGVKLVSIRMHAQMDANDLVGQFVQKPGGGFQWVDSPLVCALKSGDWVLFNSVEQCPSAVVDRLNALLEVGGKLQVPERGRANPEDLTVTPNPACRLFFTADARHAHMVSNPLRNRCVEIFVGSCAQGGDLERVCMAASGGLVESLASVEDMQGSQLQAIAREASRAVALGDHLRVGESDLRLLKPSFCGYSLVAKTISAACMVAEEISDDPVGQSFAYQWMLEGTVGTPWDVKARIENLPSSLNVAPEVVRSMAVLSATDKRWVAKTYLRLPAKQGTLLYQVGHPEEADDFTLLSGRRQLLIKTVRDNIVELPRDPRVMPHFCRLLMVLDSYDQLSAQAETSILIFLQELLDAREVQSSRASRPPAAAVACPAHLPMYAIASESTLELVLETAVRNVSTLYQSFPGEHHAQTLGDLLAQIRSLGILNRRARANDEEAGDKLAKLEAALLETVTRIVTTTREQHEMTAADDSALMPMWPAELLKCSGEPSAQRYDDLSLSCPWSVIDGLALQTEATWSTGTIASDLASVEKLYSRLSRRGPETLIRAHGGWATILGASVAEAVLRWPISEVPEAAKLAAYIREVAPSAAEVEEAVSLNCANVIERCCREAGDLPVFVDSTVPIAQICSQALNEETDSYARLAMAAAWHLVLGAGVSSPLKSLR